MGTPTHAYDHSGSLVWERELDVYGSLRKGDNEFVPFLYQGQYVDAETGLAYNRFRYIKWGISWERRQRNASCMNCQPHIERVSGPHH